MCIIYPKCTFGVYVEMLLHSNVISRGPKSSQTSLFFCHTIHCEPLWEVVRLTITDSARGPKTSLDVFPDIRASFTHPGNTQKQVLDIPDHVPYYDLVRGLWQKKKDWFWSSKKTLLDEKYGA